MSWENLKDAYRTRLGNLTAKSVLVLIVDDCGADGLGFIGLDRIATYTEIKRRTALRIIQVFGEINLVDRTEGYLKGKLRPAFQVNLGMLGLDLTAEFRRAYTQASGKCLRDTPRSVAETLQSVSETRGSVSETQPPYPLIGGPPLFPLAPPTPKPPQAGAGPLEYAVDQVMSALGISNRRKRNLLRDVIALEAEKGELAATTALAMIAAWNAQAVSSRFLRVKYGMARFFSEGIWKDSARWHWDQEALRDESRARVGS